MGRLRRAPTDKCLQLPHLEAFRARPWGKNRCRFWSSGKSLNSTKLHIGVTQAPSLRRLLGGFPTGFAPSPAVSPNLIRLSDLSDGHGSPTNSMFGVRTTWRDGSLSCRHFPPSKEGDL